MPAHRNIVVLTGAGISRGSGLATFRDPDGVWQQVRIEALPARCDLCVSFGTSGHAYPAAGFVAAVRGGTRTVERNLGPSAGTPRFAEARHGPATHLVPAVVEELRAGAGR